MFILCRRINKRDKNPPKAKKRLLVLLLAVQKNWYVPLSAQNALHLKLQGVPEEVLEQKKKKSDPAGWNGRRATVQEETDGARHPRRAD